MEGIYSFNPTQKVKTEQTQEHCQLGSKMLPSSLWLGAGRLIRNSVKESLSLPLCHHFTLCNHKNICFQEGTHKKFTWKKKNSF